MLKRLYAYKDLLLVFIWREFLIRYKQTAIGVLWAILQPVSLMLYYRDVKLPSSFLLQFLFFATPVIYSIDAVDNCWKMLLFLNPLTFIVENMRRVTIEGREIVLWQMGAKLAGIVILSFVVYRIFIRIERAFADVI